MANEIPEALEKGKKTATKASAKKTTTKKTAAKKTAAKTTAKKATAKKAAKPSSKLVIVESPAKAKTIRKTASQAGHEAAHLTDTSATCPKAAWVWISNMTFSRNISTSAARESCAIS